MPDHGLQPGETAGIITACLGGLYAGGRGIVWLFNWRERRQQWLETAIEKHVAQLEQRVAAAEARADAAEQRADAAANKNARLERVVDHINMAFQLVAAELQKRDPKSTILIQAQALLANAWPMPPDFATKLGEIHENEVGSPA